MLEIVNPSEVPDRYASELRAEGPGSGRSHTERLPDGYNADAGHTGELE